MKNTLLFTLLFYSIVSVGQVGINTTTPDTSSMLDVSSTNRGVLIPRMTEVQRIAIATPATGLLVYQIDNVDGFWYYDGVAWLNLNAQQFAENGLYVGINNHTRLGGSLIENTTVNNGIFNMTYNLDSGGDFIVQDSGVNQFVVQDNGDVRADNNTFYVDASTDRVGIGTTVPSEKLQILTGDILMSSDYSIETQTADMNIFISDANPVFAGETYGGVTRFHGDGNPVSSKLEAGGLQLHRRIQIEGGGPMAGRVLTSVDATGLALWQDAIANISAVNGLYTTANDLRLGGTLIENTTIANGIYGLNINLNSTGDFVVQDNAVPHFMVGDNGFTYFGDNSQWRVNNASTGVVFAQIFDDGTDGAMILYEGGLQQHRLDTNSETVFNDRSTAYAHVRMESDLRPNMFYMDATDNLVRIGNDLNGDTDNGLTVGGTLVDYVVDFDNGSVEGTAVGIGSIEYLLDGNGRTKINNAFVPTTHLTRDLGFSTTAEAWDDVYADDFINVSDEREKEDIQTISYGLEEVLKMRPVSYVLKKDPFKDRKLGLIAQEALELVPESVKTHDYKILNENTPNDFTKIELERMGMSYNTLIPVLIKAIQEQQEKIDELERRINQKN